MDGVEISRRLAGFALGPVKAPDAMEILRVSLLDWAAVGIAGRDEPVGRVLRAQAEDEGGSPQAGLIGSDLRVPARMAALVNGTVSHALDYDDTHFAHIGHPSVAVIPAALAVGESVGATGPALQEAALIGVEASIRVGVWLGRAHYQVGFHQTATAGAFGATLAAGRLMGLTPEQMQHAIGLVTTRASGIKAQFGSMGKPMNAGLAASNGVEAAQLAARGFLSAPGAMDGQNGFGPTHHGEGRGTAFDTLGQEWLFESVQHKFHACCHGLHATLEAMRDLDAPADRVETVEIATHPRWLSVCNIATPESGLQSKFSYRMVAAMALTGHDTARLESFDDALSRDSDLAALRDRVRVDSDDSLTEMQARLRVTLTDGTVRDLFHDLDADPGLAARQKRVRTKAAALLGDGRAEAIWQAIEADAPPEEFSALLVR
ncbi:2-methylcitrate dehydratase [Roseovarius atlanticus]|uniref:2-methylcitrate dehydratase n=1 Tax=Roseovarius atlanticus TaxID=1641875 RepID=A0A0T5NZK1_9RHOB|nr:MmgE/PrpD family protein [Roseovarius atlanticus]KRS14318.1 2-methylcitrate dehydratase [Roseovarius atlanticus]